MTARKKLTEVDRMLKQQTPHKMKALENASRHFDKFDKITVNTLEAIYGQESSFGTNRGVRGIVGAAGDFQLERKTAIRYGLIVTPKNDQRFDVDNASDASARYLKDLDRYFSKATRLIGQIRTVPIDDSDERLKFVIASFNAGEGRIARAQDVAKKMGKNPEVWDDVRKYLSKAGATAEKVKEIKDYVEKVQQYEKEFALKSKADKSVKHKDPIKLKQSSEIGEWITKDERPVFIGR